MLSIAYFAQVTTRGIWIFQEAPSKKLLETIELPSIVASKKIQGIERKSKEEISNV
jgi:hypothetical protein